jgi:hypothetical protein
VPAYTLKGIETEAGFARLERNGAQYDYPQIAGEGRRVCQLWRTGLAIAPYGPPFEFSRQNPETTNLCGRSARTCAAGDPPTSQNQGCPAQKRCVFRRLSKCRAQFHSSLTPPTKSLSRHISSLIEGRIPDAILIAERARCLRVVSQTAPGRLRASCPPVLRPVRGVLPLDWDRRKAGNAAARRVPGNLA